MKAARLASWLTVAIIAVAVSFLLWAWNTDLGRFKPWIEAQASERLGRNFAIEGPLSIRLGERVLVSARRLKVANPGWAIEPHLLSVERLDLQIDLRSLFAGPVLVHELSVSGVQASLEVSGDGAKSWEMGLPDSTKTNGDRAGPGVLVTHINLEQAEARYHAAPGVEPALLEIQHFEQAHRDDDLLALNITGFLNNRPMEYVGILGPLRNLVAGRDVRFEGRGRAGSLNIAGSGDIDYLAEPRQPTLNLQLSGASLAEFERFLPGHLLPDTPFRVHIESSPAAGRVALSVSAASDGLHLELDGSSASLLDFTDIRYRLEAGADELDMLGLMLGFDRLPPEPFQIRGHLRRQAAHLALDDVELTIGAAFLQLDGTLENFPFMGDATLALRAQGPDISSFRELLGIHGSAEGAFLASLQLRRAPSGENSFDASIETSVLNASAKGTPGPGPGFVGTEMTLSGSGPNAAGILSSYGINYIPPGAFALDARLSVQDDGLSLAPGSRLELGGNELTVSGLVALEARGLGTDIRFAAGGDNVQSVLAPSLSDRMQHFVPAEAFQVQGGLGISAGGYELRDVQASIGANSITAAGLLSRDLVAAASSLQFSVTGPNLNRALKPVTDVALSDSPFTITGHYRQTEAQMMFSKLVIQYDQLTGQASVSLGRPFDGSELHVSGRLSGPDVRDLFTGIGGVRLLANPFAIDLEGQVSKGVLRMKDSKLELGAARLSVDGLIGRNPDFSATQFRFSFEAPGLEEILELAAKPGFGDAPIVVSGALSGSIDSINLSSLDARIGDSDLTGQGSVSLTGGIPYIRLTTRSRKLDLVALAGTDESAQERTPEDGRVIPDLKFPMAFLGRLNADFNFTVDELYNAVSTQSDAVLAGFIRDGGLTIEHFEAQGLDGSLQAAGSLAPGAEGLPELEMAVKAGGLVLDLSRDPQAGNPDLPMLDVELEFQGTGEDLRSVAASANGHLYATAGAGTIPNSVISRLDARLIKQLIGVIIPPKAQSADSQLKCFAARLELEQGLVRTTPGAMLVTDKIQMISRGTINLATEELSLTFDTYPTKIYQANVSEVLINPFVKISGTLAKPALAFDAGQVGLAAATAGLSLIAKGLMARLSAASDPCAKFLEEVQ